MSHKTTKHMEIYEKPEYVYEQFYERYKQEIYRLSMKKLNGDMELAFRVVGGTFNRAFKVMDRIEKAGRFKTQAFLIAVMNVVLYEVYHEAREKMGIESEMKIDSGAVFGEVLKMEDEEVEQILIRNEMTSNLAKYAQRLPQQDKEFLFFKYFTGCTTEEICNVLNLPQREVKEKGRIIKRRIVAMMLEKEGVQ